MLITLLAFLCAAAALAVAGVVVSRHWKEIRLFDPLSLKEEQHRQKRMEFIHRRFERLRADRIQPFKRIGRHIQRGASNAYQNLYTRLQAFEAVYKNVKNPLAAMAPSTRERIKNLVSEGRSLMRDLKFADAERRFLEVLSLDQRHVEGYKGLGQIYLKQKLYPQAKETFEFLMKIKKSDDTVYSGLAEIAEAEGNLVLAEQMHEKAVQESPRQAHRHAELAVFYLEHDQLEKAAVAAERALELEKGSVKYLELALDIAIRLKRIRIARAYYDRLRLLGDEQARYQSWKDKVDALGEEEIPPPVQKKRRT